MPLPLVWWNTSLSPPISKLTSTKDDREFVASQIRDMHRNLGIVLFGLGEVCKDDLDVIEQYLADPTMTVIDATDRTARAKRDTALIYDANKLALLDEAHISDSFGVMSLKTAYRATFRTLNGLRINVFVSHWPSRLRIDEANPIRPQLATSLRSAVAAIGPDNYHILMGDYNDDPFSPSLAHHLLATRDRTMAQRARNFLYNPFWRRLGETYNHSAPLPSDSVCGSYFYKGGAFTQWHTFDQIIFSPAFLRGGAIALDEQHSRILVSDELKTKIADQNERFDHFPVLSSVSLRSQT
ncbi:endonuclease/exonuclease/phosphatase family protein [Burkholderia multivorans]|uniref:endonuclease/exonuclease/phosphatase family protein n=1 Tax=Burkholderia multivorans TaxID=87883 RepID=UPI0015912DC7|nr:endonuclease/exonuclease/phosphatase family protein [Burkholderia multivorans]MCA8336092.1 endonuclease/exonuclease/phosphatase family protein [Burkholderia multivorans]UXZ60335.1 endonuclease/exonuclease/phosphatase family protein [Burkholderia multivorans]